MSEEETTNVVAEKPVDSLTMEKAPAGTLTKRRYPPAQVSEAIEALAAGGFLLRNGGADR